MSSVHFYQEVRESCHTLNNKLIAIQGFCELMVRGEIDDTIEANLKHIREVAVDISHMTRAISLCITSQSDEQTANATITNSVSKINDLIAILRAGVEHLLQQVHEDSSKSTSYKEKALMAMQQAEEVVAQLSSQC